MEKTLQALVDECRDTRGNIVSLLRRVEDHFGFIPEDAVYWLSRALDIPASRFFGVATFYSQFHLKPRGRHTIRICRGTACHVKGSEKLISRVLMELDIPPDDDTTPDLTFTIEKINCVGACGIAPVAVLDDEIVGNATLHTVLNGIRELKKRS